MVEYLSGERIQGSSTLTSAPPQTSWKEIGRTTLSSAGDDITVSSLPDKDNLLLLYYINQSGAAGATIRVNGDTGSNYAWRNQRDGTSDTTGTSQAYINLEHSGNTTNDFGYGFMSNISGSESLTQTHSIYQGTAGAGNIPNRQETAGKWANTSTISSLTIHNADAGSYAAGSELVVLGCDNDEADSGTNFWQELADVELTSGTSGSIDTGTITAKKYLYLQLHTVPDGSTSFSLIRFNSDSGTNYSNRYSTNGGSDASYGSANHMLFYAPLNGTERYMTAFIINKSDKEKLMIGNGVARNSTGAGNAPQRRELSGKWANTSDSITSIQIHSNDETDSSRLFAAGTRLKVWGSD
jgi:hypothetical protein